MPLHKIQSAIEKSDIETLLDFLEDKTLAIELVKEIYNAKHDHKAVVGQVAMNLSLRTSVHDRQKGYSKIMVELLRNIALNPVDMGARWAVAKNPHTPVDVLRHLANDEINLVRALVATNPSTPSEVLEKFFGDEKIVRDALSGNPNTPAKLLKILIDDSDKMVRMRLADNSAVSNELLKKLMKDSDENVAKAAEVNLEKRS
ncbi:MAG: hypothetical protein U9Q62_02450 [Campylobacterota bacterium]|nr:hypothetical protein [Campylobacterota bacterium]